MIKRLALAGLLMLALAPAQAADNNFSTPGNASVQGAVQLCLNSLGLAVPCNGGAGIDAAGIIAETASATGTTTAVTATLAAASGKTTYICGFDIGAVATAAAAGNATVTGTITGTLNFEQGTGATPAVVHTTQNFRPCVPANATNTAIAVVSAAAGTGGVVSVTAWGYQY